MDCLVAATRFILFTLFGSTITVILLVTPCDFTEILQLPGATATIFPFDETFATDVFVDLYVNFVFLTTLSDFFKTASIVVLSPGSRITFFQKALFFL